MFGLLLVVGLSTAWAEVPDLAVPAAGLSSKEKYDAAESAVLEMRQSVTRVEQLLEAAKTSQGPEEEVRCLQSALTPMQALLSIGLDTQNSLKQALAAADTAHADLEYRKILVALSKVREFLAKALLCAGNPPGMANSITQSNIIVSPDEIPDVSTDLDPESNVPLSATPF